MDDRWRGFQYEVRPDSVHPERYEVEFWPNELMAASGPAGEVRAIAPGTIVTVEDQAGLKVIGFHAAEQQYADVQRSDYEEKALDVVADYLEKHEEVRGQGALHG